MFCFVEVVVAASVPLIGQLLVSPRVCVCLVQGRLSTRRWLCCAIFYFPLFLLLFPFSAHFLFLSFWFPLALTVVSPFYGEFVFIQTNSASGTGEHLKQQQQKQQKLCFHCLLSVEVDALVVCVCCLLTFILSLPPFLATARIGK